MIRINDEVYYSGSSLTTCDSGLIDNLKQKASQNPRKRVRLCAHPDVNASLHEMLIVHERNCYVRPHKHPGKAESTHIIEGLVDIVLFDEEGKIKEVISMGAYGSGLPFYLRIDAPVYHTLLIRSDVLVFHETTTGPFNRNDTFFAPWSPEDADTETIPVFVNDIEQQLSKQNQA